jgi:sulfite reductase (NADPH) hemoprotein beta-component
MTDTPVKAPPVKALTANLLVEGDVVFWGQGGWREQFAEADLMDDPAAADAVLDAAKAASTVVVDAYLIDVAIEEDGSPVPISFRERVRALGPTIHPDMGKQAEGGSVIEAMQHAHGAARSTGRVNLIRRK